jgi:hypothetical protein
LPTERLNALVYIQFNLKMMNKRGMIKLKKIDDVLISSKTTEAQGFLFERGDDCAVFHHRDEEDEEMPSTNIPWFVIGEAMGVDEQLQRRRSARIRDFFEHEEFESEEEESEEDEDFMTED